MKLIEILACDRHRFTSATVEGHAMLMLRPVTSHGRMFFSKHKQSVINRTSTRLSPPCQSYLASTVSASRSHKLHKCRLPTAAAMTSARGKQARFSEILSWYYIIYRCKWTLLNKCATSHLMLDSKVELL